MNKILVGLTLIFLFIIGAEVFYIFAYQGNNVQTSSNYDLNKINAASGAENSSLVSPPQFTDIGVSLLGEQHVKSALANIVVEGTISNITFQNKTIVLEILSSTSNQKMSLYLNQEMLQKTKIVDKNESLTKNLKIEDLKKDQNVQISLEFDMLNKDSTNLYKSITIVTQGTNENS